VADRYRSLDFPFQELTSPPLAAHAQWSCEDLLAYLRTWSASESYLKAHGTPATDQIREALSKQWGPGVRPVNWPLFMRVGRVAGTKL
jgi:phosphopantetheinyl transferase